MPFLNILNLNPFFREVHASEADIDTAISTTQAIHNGTSPTIVVTSNTTAYAFYVDSTGQGVYSKTTDLNATTPTWSAAVQIDSQADVVHIAVWYDKWTPGDTGTNIHIITIDTSLDDLWYNRLDTSTDTRLLTASPVAISSSPGPVFSNTMSNGGTTPAITKATDGTIFAGVIDITSSWVVKCSVTCNTASNWSNESPDFETATQTMTVQDNMLLMPQPDGDIMMIDHNDTTDDVLSKIYDRSADTWSSFVAVDSNAPNNTTYDGTIGATIDRSTFEIYLVYAAQISTIGTDDDIRTAVYNPATSTWTAKTDCITNLAITGAKIGRDESSGTLYCVYTRRTTAATAATGNVFFKTSTDNMATWSGESASLTTTPDDLYGARVPILSNEHMYVSWYDLTADDLNGNTVADLTPITSSIEQAVYRFYANTDSTDVGSTLAASNTTAALTLKGDSFRLRVLLKVTTANLAITGQQFKLQYVNSGGSACSTSTLVWSDVSSTTAIAYKNNATPTDASNLTSNANDPINGADTIVNQTYEEANNFTNTTAAVNTGQDGKWDFSLIDNGATGGATYCLRVVKAGGDSLNTYTQYPQVTIASSPVFTQSNFRLYANANSTDVGAALANQNTNFTLTSDKQVFRLRMLITFGTNGVVAGGQSFKLQYAGKGAGSCSAPSGTPSTYTDITTTTALAFNDNATPTDASNLTSNVNDPTSSNTIVNQTYEEANNFTNTTASISASQDGLWDFSLKDLDMTNNTAYCVRAVTSDGTVFNTYSQYPQITSLNGGAIDKTPFTTAAAHFNTGSQTVFISDQYGYVFYIDSTGTGVYRKTTDGGSTWGNPVTVDSQTDVVDIVVWYDRWTPGDNLGNKIYVLTADSGSDDLWYTELDTAGDTLTTPVAINGAQGGTLAAGESLPSITKGTNNNIYAGVIDSTDNYVLKCDATCTTAGNWAEIGGASQFANQNDALVLMPLASSDILCIWWDKTANTVKSRKYNRGSQILDAAVTIDAANNDNVTYRGGISAVANKSTNDIYMTVVGDASTLGTDDDVRTYTYSGGSWSAKTNVLTNTTKGVLDSKIFRDENTGDLYDIYAVQETAGTAATGNIYYKKSTDNMTTWGSEQGPINSSQFDVYGLSSAEINKERIYITAFDNTNVVYRGYTVVDLTPPSTTSPYLVQTSVNIGTTTVSSLSKKLPLPVTTGNLIVVALSEWNSNADPAVSSITDSFSNTYQLAVEDPTGQTSITPVAVYYAYNVTGGTSNQITVNFTQLTQPSIAIYEYANIYAAADPKDQTAHANAGGVVSTSGSSGATATTAYASELVFAAFSHQSTSTTATPGTGFTMLQYNDDNGSTEVLYTEEQIVSSTGAYTGTITFAAAVDWRATVVTFRGLNNSGAPTNEQLMRHGGYFNSSGVKQPFTF